LVPCILTLLFPIVCETSYTLTIFFRCIIGLTESATFPAVFHFYPIWAPIEEKTMMISLVGAGMYFGEIIGFSFSGALVESKYGWQSVFYIFGLPGVLWFILWAFRAYESPDAHPYMTREEVELVKKGECYELSIQYPFIVIVFIRLIGKQFISINDNDTDQSMHNQSIRNPVLSEEDIVDIELSSVHNLSPKNTSDYEQVALESDSMYIPAVNTNETSTIQNKEDFHQAKLQPPFQQFYSHPIALTLFLNSWTYVSILFTQSASDNCDIFLVIRDSFVSRYCLKCLLFSMIILDLISHLLVGCVSFLI
jgi:hypothetical protein